MNSLRWKILQIWNTYVSYRAGFQSPDGIQIKHTSKVESGIY